MQEIKLDKVMNEQWAELLTAFLSNHFRREEGYDLSFSAHQVGAENFAIHVKGEIGSHRDKLFYWTGYYYSQIMLNNNPS